MKAPLYLAALLALAGCRQVADPTPDSSMTATVSGELDYVAQKFPTGFSNFSSDADTAAAPGCLNLFSQSGNTYLSIRICKFRGVGTYSIRARPATGRESQAYYERDNSTSVWVYDTQYLLPMGAVVGQVVVSSYDPASRHVQGAFRFTGTRFSLPGQLAGTPVEVSNGRFVIYSLAIR